MPLRLFTLSRIFNMGKRTESNLRDRIKDVRRRPRAGTPTGGASVGAPSSQPSGGFSSLSTAPSFPTSGFTAPSTQSNGFTFGQSQSFPGASSAPAQPNQTGSASFSFGGTGNTGFNFSSGLGTSTNNPFATNSFSAGPSAFPQPANTGTAGFVGFGNQSASQPSFSGEMFGTQQAPTTSSSTPPIFGQAANSSAANSVSDSMQTSPDAKPKGPSFAADSSSTQKNLFGTTGATGTPNLFPAQPAAAPTSNPFGGLSATATTAKPSSDKAEEPAAKPGFAVQTGASSTPAQPFGSLFGTPAPTPAATQPEKAQAAQPATSNLFAPKAAPASSPGPATSPQPFTSLFGASTSSPPTFGGLSASKPAEQAPVGNLFAPKPATEQQGTGQTANAQPAFSLFGNTVTPPSVSAPEKSQTPAPAATPSLFSQKPAAEKPAESQSFKFFSSTTTAAPSEATEAAKPQAAPSLFAPKPAAASSPGKTTAAQPFGSLFGASTAPSGPSEPSSAASPSLFAAKPSAEQIPTGPVQNPVSSVGNLFGAKTTAPEPKAPGAPEGAPNTARAAKSPLEKIPQLGQPGLPGSNVNDDAELLWKVDSLDHFFKQEIGTYQPGTESFDNLILFYMKARHAMGAPVKPKGALKLKNGMLTHMGTPGRPVAAPAKPTLPAPSSASATSNLFSQSFSSSPPPKADAPSPAKPASAPTTSPPPKPNPFASLSTGGATNATAVKATDANVSSAPKLGGNMFSNATTAGAQAPAASTGIPKFGNGASGTDFMAQFKKKAEQSMAEEKAKRKAEDFDSDEDDEAEWERLDAEKQREKRAKLEATSKKKTIFVPGEGFKFVDVDEADSSTGAAKPAEKSPLAALSPAAPSPAPSTSSIFESSSRPLSNSENIFGRLSATPQPSTSGKDSDDEEKSSSPKRRASDVESAEEDDFAAAAMRNPKRTKPSDNTDTTKSSLDKPLPAPTAAAGRSLFDRVESPAPSKETATSSLFSSSLNKATASPSDQTWKPNSPIKFSTQPPATGLFGATVPSVPASTQDSSADNATSGAATPDEEAAPGAIYDMSNANAGEEEEEVAFECRARAFKLATGWVSQGTGVVRLLKHPGTGRSRIVLRADPGGNVILNTLLRKDFDYGRANSSVQFMVPQPGLEKPEHWAIRVKAASIEGLHNKIQEIKN